MVNTGIEYWKNCRQKSNILHKSCLTDYPYLQQIFTVLGVVLLSAYIGLLPYKHKVLGGNFFNIHISRLDIVHRVILLR
jgi:hypothetical protein